MFYSIVNQNVTTRQPYLLPTADSRWLRYGKVYDTAAHNICTANIMIEQYLCYIDKHTFYL